MDDRIGSEARTKASGAPGSDPKSELRSRILLGAIEPGGRVNISRMSEELEAGVTPIREALFSLESEGWVRNVRGRGFVASPLDREEALGLYPMIWMLETAALREAPPTHSQLERMRRINDELEEVAADAFRAVELDRQWHEAMIARYRNRHFSRELARLRERLARYELAFMTDLGRVSASIGEHAAIVDALELGEVDRAAELLRDNWESGATFLLEWIDGRKPAGKWQNA